MEEKVITSFGQSSRTSLNELAYNRIKEAIIYCEIKPGTWISENALSQSLNMSRTPVREALKMLVNEGFLETRQGIGALVKEIELKDLVDLYDLRKTLECMAAETSIMSITNYDIKYLREVWSGMLEKMKNHEKVDSRIIGKYDNELHGLIIDRCRNGYLKSVMTNIRQHILRYQLLTVMALGDMEATIRQHLEIIDIMEERNINELIPALKCHIEEAAEIIKNNNWQLYGSMRG